jgi:nucleotide-binding universal stress UspA family protein
MTTFDTRIAPQARHRLDSTVRGRSGFRPLAITTGVAGTGPLVVAGVDGSDCARHAARWAADEADRRHGRLLLVHAYALPAAGYSGYNPFPGDLLATLEEEAHDTVDALVTELQHRHRRISIGTFVTYGDAVTVLRNAASGAALAVVGGHRTNRIAMALGSVAGRFAAGSHVPVAVVHAVDTPDTGPVVVGIDGSPAGEGAIGFAFQEADLRGVPLVAVHSWTSPVAVAPVPAYSATVVDDEPIEQSERALLSQRLAGWSERYPDVPVRRVLTRDVPATAILRHSTDAQLVVVGTRWHAALSALLLGSTSQALITHSAAPVVVVGS